MGCRGEVGWRARGRGMSLITQKGVAFSVFMGPLKRRVRFFCLNSAGNPTLI